MKKKSADFTSLYLYVQKGKKFPAGHPQIFIKYEFDNIDITDVYGLVKCCILPPRDLYFPVLPVRLEEILCIKWCAWFTAVH